MLIVEIATTTTAQLHSHLRWETDVIDPGSVIERGGGPVRTAVAADADAVVSRKSETSRLYERYAMNCLH
jgi:hypothetical protein